MNPKEHRDNDLPTLRCSIALQNRRPVLVTQAFVGAEPLWTEQITTLDTFFVQLQSAQGHAAARRTWIKDIVDDKDHPIAWQLRSLSDAIADDLPIWLQITPDSADASVLPWESLINSLTQRGTLRVPTFRRNPVSFDGTLRFAVCVATTGEEHQQVALYELRMLLNALKIGVSGGSTQAEIVLFLPVDMQDVALEDLDRLNDGAFRIISAPPFDADAAAANDPERSSAASEEANPWLAWIRTYFSESEVDAVHFICAGHAAGDDATLLLSQSPFTRVKEPSWRFVGENELSRFYDATGASIAGFSAMGDDASCEAIKLFAYQLSWSHPGSIYVKDADQQDGGLPFLLRAICTDRGLDTRAPTTSLAYAYPQILQRPRTTYERVSQENRYFSAPHPQLEEEVRFQPKETSEEAFLWGLDGIPFSKEHRIFDRVVRYTLPGSNLVPTTINLPVTEPNPTQTTRYIETERARISSVTTRTPLELAQDYGTQAALSFVEDLMKK